jgi:hypothetical protein
MESNMKPAAAASLALLEVYIILLAEELVKMIPAARKPTIATWYLWVASDAMATKMPRMRQSIYATLNQEKLGYGFALSKADMIEETKVVIQASCQSPI